MRLLRSVLTGSLALAEIGCSWLREAVNSFARPAIVQVEAGTSAAPSTTYASFAERSFGLSSGVASITLPSFEHGPRSVPQQRERAS